jgi:DNA repair protein RAD16
MWTDLEKKPAITPIAAEQPVSISRKLKPFQLEGLNWMMKQEKTPFKGGLLGDEMGMGKTIQAVSLIMSDYPVRKPSLVVVPPVALIQWQSEIKVRTVENGPSLKIICLTFSQEYTNGKLKVLVYHNSNPKVKLLRKKDLESYDIIMISCMS